MLGVSEDYLKYTESVFAQIADDVTHITLDCGAHEFHGRSIENDYLIILDNSEKPSGRVWTISVYAKNDFALAYRSTSRSPRTCVLDAANRYLKIKRGYESRIEYEYHGWWYPQEMIAG